MRSYVWVSANLQKLIQSDIRIWTVYNSKKCRIGLYDQIAEIGTDSVERLKLNWPKKKKVSLFFGSLQSNWIIFLFFFWKANIHVWFQFVRVWEREEARDFYGSKATGENVVRQV